LLGQYNRRNNSRNNHTPPGVAQQPPHGSLRMSCKTAKPPQLPCVGHPLADPQKLLPKSSPGSHPLNPRLPLYAPRPKLPPTPSRRCVPLVNWSPDCADSRDCPCPNSLPSLVFRLRPSTAGKSPRGRSIYKPVC